MMWEWCSCQKQTCLTQGGRLDLSSLDPTLTSVLVEYESEVDASIIWTEPIDGSFSVTERATLTK